MADVAISNQLAVGRVTLVSFPTYNLMAWSGTDDGHSLNLGTAAPGEDFPSASTGLAGNANPVLCGPAVAVLPTGDAAYLAWVGSDGRICVTRATPGDGTVPAWSVGEVWTIGNSTPRSPPAAALGSQNGHLVLNVIWQDGAAGSMVLAQLLIGQEVDSLAFCALGPSCTGTPNLTCGASGSYLAWSSGPSDDGLYALNLARDPRGGVNFDFGAALSHIGAACAYGMVYVPLGTSHGCAVYADAQGVSVTQIGRNQSGDWVVNSAPGTTVTIAGAPPDGPPNAGVRWAMVDGVLQRAVGVIWPGTWSGSPANSILSTTVTPVVAAIPVVQCVIA